MTSTGVVIGGHEGLDVVREDGVIIKRGRNVLGEHGPIDNITALRNEARFLQVMAGSGFTPDLLRDFEIEGDVATIIQTDLGDNEPMRDGEVFRRNCTQILDELRRRNVRHGDLTSANIILRGDWPWVVDWQEAHFIGKPAPQKQPFSDSHLLWRTVADMFSAETKAYDTPRVARRWLAVLGALGATFNLDMPLKGRTLLDLGCFQGDFVAAAICERMRAHGVDRGGFRTGENSIEIARGLWSGVLGCEFSEADIMSWPDFRHDVVLLFSTWSYIVQEYRRRAAEELLARIVTECGVLFFENQLWGDGPGPDFFQNDGDIETLLGRFGHVRRLVTIPVWGRPASRTVWEVRS